MVSVANHFVGVFRKLMRKLKLVKRQLLLYIYIMIS